MFHRRFINMRALVFALGAGSAGLGLSSAASAQGWPQGKPIAIVVGYPAGGSVDLVARTIAEPLARRLGTPVVVENASGAGGTIGAQKVVSAAADGYTLLLGSGSEVSIARLFSSSVRYNGETDLTPVGMVGVAPLVLVATPTLGVKTIGEAIAKSKSAPDKYSFASAGVGSPQQVSGELLNMMAGTSLRHVPYRGAAQAVQDVIGGNIEFGIFVLSSAMPHIEAGKMVALGVTTPTRSTSAPLIPPLAETPALKGYDMSAWFALFAPAKLPAATTARLNKELNELLHEPEVVQKLQKAGISNDGGTPQQLQAFIQAEAQRAGRVVTRLVASGVLP